MAIKKRITLSVKVLSATSIAFIVTVVVLTVFAYNNAKTSLMQQAFNQLTAIDTIKKTQIQNYFQERIGDVRVLASNPFVKSAIKDLETAFKQGGGIVNGGFKGLNNGNYNAPPEYRAVHNRYFPTFNYYMTQYGYYDFFLMSADTGDVYFTVVKEADFGQRTADVDSSLRDVWRLSVTEGKVAISDTKPYSPSGGVPAQFISAPVKENNKIIGVVALQIPLKAINSLMTERSGMGKTGESYLVGSDKLMRSDSYLDPENHSVEASFKNPQKGMVDTDATLAAFSGKNDTEVIIDYNGNPVLSAFAPVKVGDSTWAVISEIDLAEVEAPVIKFRNYIILFSTAIVILALVVLAYLIRRLVIKPIQHLKEISGYIAKGNFERTVEYRSSDEMGDLGISLNEVSNNLKNLIKEIADFAQKFSQGDLTERLTVGKREDVGMLGDISQALNDAVDNMDKLLINVITSVQSVAQAIEQIASGNQTLSQRTSEQASSLEEIASTIEETTATIKQNAENAESANKQSIDASNMAEQGAVIANDAVLSINEISQSSKKIGEIITIINEISFQTNLLALNAAVEAARAGEQGRGFAVVAGEVRNLAQRSATAAKEISTLINDSIDKIENGTELVNKSGEALKEITSAVSNVSKVISEIAAASQEQKQGVNQVNNAVSEMDTMTQQNAALVEETASASEEMSNQAQELMSMVENFKVSKMNIIGTRERKNIHLNMNNIYHSNETTKASKEEEPQKNSEQNQKNKSDKDMKQIMEEEGFEEF